MPCMPIAMTLLGVFIGQKEEALSEYFQGDHLLHQKENH